MGKLTQLAIATILLGAVLTLMGFFPGVIGMEAAGGVGVLQTLAILVGFAMLIGGAYMYVGTNYQPAGKKLTLTQRIAVRLSMTGLLFATATGLADVLGFGSHAPAPPFQRPMVGNWQMAGLFIGFAVASLGVILFALTGDHGDESSL